MEWREISDELISSILKRDVFSSNGDVLFKKGTSLDEPSLRLLKQHSIKKVFISVSNLKRNLSKQLDALSTKSTQPHFWDAYINLMEELKFFYSELSLGKRPPADNLNLKLYQTIGLLKNQQEFFEFAYDITGHEDSLYRHSVNVSVIAYIFGLNGVSPEKPFSLAQMGLFHDIGKTVLNQDVLNKSCFLTEDEKAHIKSHTKVAPTILKQVNIHSKALQNVALLHHENRNGQGYPFGLSKANIPFSAQIISVIDIFDSAATDRIYKKQKPIFIVLNELYTDTIRGKLHPLIVFTFIEEVMNSFVNHNIILSDNRLGSIYHTNPKNFLRPIILLEDNSFVDLSQKKEIHMVDFV